MHVERYGHGGAPILLVHGFGTCSFLWRNVGPVMAMANRTAFAIDLLPSHEIGKPAHLFSRIDPKNIDVWRAQFGGTTATAAAAGRPSPCACWTHHRRERRLRARTPMTWP